MRIPNIIAAFLVVVCNIWVSFHHSLDLFIDGGFTGGLEYVAVVAVELTFLMGGLNIVASRLKGVSPGAPAIMGGLLGVLLVSWSNIAAGWAYGITGVLLGLATPISLIIAEAILSRAIMNNHALSNQLVTKEDEELITTQHPIEKTTTSPVIEEAIAIIEAPVSEMDTPVVEVEETEKKEKTSAKSKPAEVLDETKKKKVMKKKKKTTSSEVDYEEIIKVAKDLQEQDENKKPPSRNLLAKEAKTTPHHARVALAKLESPANQETAKVS
jgi:hypothetical protein